MPEISVIVPVYNVEKYLPRCVGSILSQTFGDFELILVDDGSPDGCGAICDAYAQKDERVKVIHKKNGGLSDARNAGIDVACGEYLAFIDSDDWVHTGFLKALYDNAKKYHAEISMVNLHKEYDSYSENALEISEGICDKEQAMEYLYGDTGIYMNVAWNKLYQRNLFEGIRYPVGKLHEDGFTTYKLIHKAKQVYISNEDLYYYYQRTGSIMNEQFSLRRIDEYEVYLERAEFFQQKQMQSLFLKNEKTRLACMKSLTMKLLHSNAISQKEKDQVLKRFKKDVKKNYKYMMKDSSQKIKDILYCLSPTFFAYFRRAKEKKSV